MSIPRSIQFENSHDVYQFLLKLNRKKLIMIENIEGPGHRKNVNAESSILAQQLVMAKDGSTYLLADLTNEDLTQNEIEPFKIKFPTKDGKELTLAEVRNANAETLALLIHNKLLAEMLCHAKLASNQFIETSSPSCPISKSNVVFACTSIYEFSYEYENIHKWVKLHEKDPGNNQPLSEEQIIPNPAAISLLWVNHLQQKAKEEKLKKILETCVEPAKMQRLKETIEILKQMNNDYEKSLCAVNELQTSLEKKQRELQSDLASNNITTPLEIFAYSLKAERNLFLWIYNNVIAPPAPLPPLWPPRLWLQRSTWFLPRSLHKKSAIIFALSYPFLIYKLPFLIAEWMVVFTGIPYSYAILIMLCVIAVTSGLVFRILPYIPGLRNIIHDFPSNCLRHIFRYFFKSWADKKTKEIEIIQKSQAFLKNSSDQQNLKKSHPLILTKLMSLLPATKSQQFVSEDNLLAEKINQGKLEKEEAPQLGEKEPLLSNHLSTKQQMEPTIKQETKNSSYKIATLLSKSWDKQKENSSEQIAKYDEMESPLNS